MSVAARLLEHVRTAVPAVVDVSITTAGQAATVRVFPAEQQAAAQAAINTFDWSPAAHAAWLENQNPERKTLRQAAAQAVADIDAYLALANPTNAQVVAHVRRLSQITRAVVRRLAQID